MDPTIFAKFKAFLSKVIPSSICCVCLELLSTEVPYPFSVFPESGAFREMTLPACVSFSCILSAGLLLKMLDSK